MAVPLAATTYHAWLWLNLSRRRGGCTPHVLCEASAGTLSAMMARDRYFGRQNPCDQCRAEWAGGGTTGASRPCGASGM